MAPLLGQDPPAANVNDDDYNESEDEDFNPDAIEAQEEDASSESEDETTATASAKRKRAKPANEAEELDFENSGDEATIQSGRRKKKKKKSKDAEGGSDEEGGEGGLIKTRAQRKLEQKEKKALASSIGATVDVNALWAQMATGPKPVTVEEKPNAGASQANDAVNGSETTAPQVADTENATPSIAGKDIEPTILIKRTYDFAGQTMTEEKRVPASSAEAKVHLAELERQKEVDSSSTKTNSTASSGKPPLRRPKKRAPMFGNNFNADSAKEPKKLTTLEKSKLDWAQHVDQEGISEELDEHAKAKDTYLGRMDFLGRMNAKREDEARERRAKG